MRSRSAHRWQFVVLTGFLLAAASAFVTGVGAGPAHQAGGRVGRRVGEVPAAATPEAFQGYLPPTQSITMIISFEPRDLADLQRLIADLYNPASGQYRHWLGPKEFGNRFGRTEEEFNQALNWLGGQGFVINTAFSNRLDIAFTGTVDTVQQAFNVRMGSYWDSANSRSFYSNMQSPILPRQIDAMTEGLEGLNDAVMYHTHAQATPTVHPQSGVGRTSVKTRVRPSGIPGTPNFMAPADLAFAYDFKSINDENILGQGQKVGIIIDSDVEDSDVALYRSVFGLPSADIVRLVPTGLTSPGVQPAGEGEAILDVSSISASAPLAEIDLVLIPNLSLTNIRLAEQAIVNDGSIHVVNESLGICEQQGFAAAEQTTFDQAVTQGVAFFAAAGDQGAECGNAFPGVQQIECPACYAGVTAVGGTQIQATFNQVTGGIISVQSEEVWNSPPGDTQSCTGAEPFPAGATGGGVSQIVPIPAYQAGAQGPAGGVPSGANRVVPDVSALAGAPFTMAFIGGNTFSFVGTSQAAPLWAGMVTLVNQLNGSPIGSPNPLIYQLGLAQYNGTLPGSFHDITVGNNSVLPREPCDPNGVAGYSAQFGFDPVSGWGSPDLAVLVNNAASLGSPQCSYSISESAFTFGSSGGSTAVAVTTSASCSWSATSPADWITITSGSSGSGDGTVSISIQPNPFSTSRTATLDIAGQSCAITEQAPVVLTAGVQQPGTIVAAASGFCLFDVSEFTISVPGNATQLSVSLSGNTSDELSVRFQQPVSVSNGALQADFIASGQDGFASITITPTSSPALAAGTYFIAVENCTTNAFSFNLLANVTVQSSCIYSLSQSAINFGSSPGVASIAVTTSASCSWSATSPANWITITSGSTGFGNGAVGISVLPNPAPTPRTATLDIAGQTCTITQQAVMPLSTGVQQPGTIVAAATGFCLFDSSEYTISVPSNATQLSVALSGTNPDELSVRFQQPVSVSNGALQADFIASGQNGVASITITPASSPALAAGTYFIAVENCATSAFAFDLVANVSVQSASGPVISSLAANLNGDVLTLTGASFDPFNLITKAQVFLLDPSGNAVGSTNPFAVSFPNVANVNFTLTVTGLDKLPSALEARAVLIDALGNVSNAVTASFSQGDPGGPLLNSGSYSEVSELMVLKGQVFASPEVEVDGVIVSPPALAKVKGGGTKLKVFGSQSALNLAPSLNRVRIIIDGLRSNFLMISG
jgi:subtilase family serine protease